MLESMIHGLSASCIEAGCEVVVFGAIFYVLARFAPLHSTGPWWRKADVKTDLFWWFAAPVSAQIMGVLAMVVLLGLTTRLTGEVSAAKLIRGGFGPVGRLPLAAQVVVYLLGLDLMMFASHWVFHRTSLWRFHAEHHKTEQVEWLSSSRFHPLDQLLHGAIPNLVLVLIGVPAEVFIVAAPIQSFHGMLVHANLDWDFGPFRYVLASPVFHRWHHTHSHEGGMKNFAPTFPIIDVLAGSFYMPKGKRPSVYGLDKVEARAPEPSPAVEPSLAPANA